MRKRTIRMPSRKEIAKATEEEVVAVILKFQDELFAALTENDPGFRKEMEPDFREWRALHAKVMTRDNGSIKDVRKALPNNKWGHLLNAMVAAKAFKPVAPPTEKDDKEFAERVADRLVRKRLR